MVKLQIFVVRIALEILLHFLMDTKSCTPLEIYRRESSRVQQEAGKVTRDAGKHPSKFRKNSFPHRISSLSLT
jgi:hypothetical protein